LEPPGQELVYNEKRRMETRITKMRIKGMNFFCMMVMLIASGSLNFARKFVLFFSFPPPTKYPSSPDL